MKNSCLVLVLLAAISGCKYYEPVKEMKIISAYRNETRTRAFDKCVISYKLLTPRGDKNYTLYSSELNSAMRLWDALNQNLTFEEAGLTEKADIEVAFLQDDQFSEVPLNIGLFGNSGRELSRVTKTEDRRVQLILDGKYNWDKPALQKTFTYLIGSVIGLPAASKEGSAMYPYFSGADTRTSVNEPDSVMLAGLFSEPCNLWIEKEDVTFEIVGTNKLRMTEIRGSAYVMSADGGSPSSLKLYKYNEKDDVWNPQASLSKQMTPTRPNDVFLSDGSFGYYLAYNEIYRYNPEENSWKLFKKELFEGDGVFAAMLNNSIYWVFRDRGSDWQIMVLNLATDEVKISRGIVPPNMPFISSSSVCFTFNHKIYYDTGMTNSLFELDIANKVFNAALPFPNEDYLASYTFFSHQDILYFVGTKIKSGIYDPLRLVYKYDDKRKLWQKVGDVMLSGGIKGSFYVNGKAYILTDDAHLKAYIP